MKGPVKDPFKKGRFYLIKTSSPKKLQTVLVLSQSSQPPRCNGKGRGVQSLLHSGVEQRSFAHTVSLLGALPLTSHKNKVQVDDTHDTSTDTLRWIVPFHADGGRALELHYDFLKQYSTANSQTIPDESVTCIAVKEDRHQNIMSSVVLRRRIEEPWASQKNQLSKIQRNHVEKRHRASNNRVQKSCS